MPDYDPLSPDRPVECYRTRAARMADYTQTDVRHLYAEPGCCTGSRCSAWRPQVAVKHRPRKGARMLTATVIWNTGVQALVFPRAESMTPTGLGVCAENPDAPPWRDPQAPKEPDHAR